MESVEEGEGMEGCEVGEVLGAVVRLAVALPLPPASAAPEEEEALAVAPPARPEDPVPVTVAEAQGEGVRVPPAWPASCVRVGGAREAEAESVAPPMGGEAEAARVASELPLGCSGEGETREEKVSVG